MDFFCSPTSLSCCFRAFDCDTHVSPLVNKPRTTMSHHQPLWGSHFVSFIETSTLNRAMPVGSTTTAKSISWSIKHLSSNFKAMLTNRSTSRHSYNPRTPGREQH